MQDEQVPENKNQLMFLGRAGDSITHLSNKYG
jgi:hypothetical protein